VNDLEADAIPRPATAGAARLVGPGEVPDDPARPEFGDDPLEAAGMVRIVVTHDHGVDAPKAPRSQERHQRHACRRPAATPARSRVEQQQPTRGLDHRREAVADVEYRQVEGARRRRRSGSPGERHQHHRCAPFHGAARQRDRGQ